MNLRARVPLVALTALLAACEPAFDVDVAADPPAETLLLADQAVRVTLPLKGVVLRKADASTRSISRDAVPVDLLRFDGETVFSLLSSEKVDGDYQAVSLDIDDSDFDAELETQSGGIFPTDLPDSLPYTPLEFSIDKDSNDRVSLTLALDLRLSLDLNPDTDRYRLDPVLRAVRSGDGASVSGLVASALLPALDCDVGAAVYAYAGDDVEPDERDGAAAEPYATAPVLHDSGDSQGRYTLRNLPAGLYTLSLTCDGEREDGLDAADPLMEFGDGLNIELDDGESLSLDFTV